jgi:lipoprotein signal peptidase
MRKGAKGWTAAVVGLAVVAFLFDWATKGWALATVRDSAANLGMLTFHLERNDAFAFSSGSGVVSTWLVVALRVLALLAVSAMCASSMRESRRYAVGVALLLAGGAGNTFDLALRNGAVVDFIRAGPVPLAWPFEHFELHFVFNTADVWVLLGLLLIAPLIHRHAREVQSGLARWEAEKLAEARAVRIGERRA